MKMTEYALYIDDGGHPADRPFLVAAGFLSRKEKKWKAFEQQEAAPTIAKKEGMTRPKPRQDAAEIGQQLSGGDIRA